MPDESAPGERVTLLTICFPPEDLDTSCESLAVGGHKTERFRSVRCTKDTGDPAIVRLLHQKPLRPVVLRPHLSAGLPLNSLSTMRWIRRPCKALFSTHQEQGFGVLHGLR